MGEEIEIDPSVGMKRLEVEEGGETTAVFNMTGLRLLIPFSRSIS